MITRVANGTIYYEDCIEGMKNRIPDGSIDLVVTDPPFGIFFDQKDKKDYSANSKANMVDGYVEIAPEDYQDFSNNWVKEAYRCLKDNGNFVVFSSWQQQDKIKRAMVEAGFIIVNHIIWHFHFALCRPQTGYSSKRFTYSSYHIFYGVKTKDIRNSEQTFNALTPEESWKFLERNGGFLKVPDESNDDKVMRDVIIYRKESAEPNSDEPRNMTRLPPLLVEYFIRVLSNEGDTVLDCFAGNGTISAVSENNGRNHIAFELNTKAEVAIKHLMDKLSKIYEIKGYDMANEI